MNSLRVFRCFKSGVNNTGSYLAVENEKSMENHYPYTHNHQFLFWFGLTYLIVLSLIFTGICHGIKSLF